MHRLIFAGASSSSDKAERPHPVASGSASSAERPATRPPSAAQHGNQSRSKTLSIRDVQRWLAEESIVRRNSAGARRVREAVAVLPPPKPRKEDVRLLQSKLQVAQKKKTKKPRPIGDMLQEF